MSRPSVERVLNAILVFTSLSMVTLLLRRELKGPDESPATREMAPERIPRWDALLAESRPLQRTGGQVRLVVFDDFECPFCRSFARTLKDASSEFAHTLEVRIVHLPLRQHRFAEITAQGAECAAEQGRFATYHDMAFEHQDSLGLLSFGELARRAGVEDTLRFLRCLKGPLNAAVLGGEESR